MNIPEHVIDQKIVQKIKFFNMKWINVKQF
jgi:hypothetical protein